MGVYGIQHTTRVPNIQLESEGEHLVVKGGHFFV